MRTLISGATGFLGRHVVRAALAQGQTVRALVRPSASVEPLGWPPAVEIHRADLRTARPETLTEAFEDVDAVIHLAAGVTGDDDARFAATVVGTENLLEAMRHATTRRIVLASSFSIYDWGAVGRVLTESSPPVTDRLYERDGYTIAKVWQERVTSRICDAEGWDLTVLRPGAIWGDRNLDLPDLGQSMGRYHFVIGPLRRLPLTYVEHCAEAFARAAANDGTAGRTYNLMDDHRVSTWRYTGAALRHLGGGRRIPVPYLLGLLLTHAATACSRLFFGRGGKLPSILVPCRYVARFTPGRCDTGAARRDLAWRPTYSFSEAMARACRHGHDAAEPAP